MLNEGTMTLRPSCRRSVRIRDSSAASGERLAALGSRLVHDAQRSGLGCVVAALPLVVAAIASVT